MRLLWCVSLLSACYSPSFVRGAPCDPVKDNCPIGQECLPSAAGYTCDGVGATNDASLDSALIDSSIDADISDTDGDGVPNVRDNCPALANPNQHDEDADAIGDVCDPCPIATNNTDGDGDGVGDDCDPHPMVPGDTLRMFEPFAQAPLPLGWSSTGGAAPWVIANDEIRSSSGNNTIGWIRTNISTTPRMTVMTSVVIERTFGAPAGAGIAAPFSLNQADGIWCAHYVDIGPRRLTLHDIGTDSSISTASFAWTDNSTYRLRLQRTDTVYACSSTPALGSPGAMVTGVQGGAVPAPVVGLRSDSATTRFQWILVVQSP